MEKRSPSGIEKKKQYCAEYKKNNYKRIPLDVTHEKYEQIKQQADNLGETVNGYIKKAIDKRIEEES